MTPAISVILPAYYRHQKLHWAIESMLAQTLTSLEILVCEIGSSAETEQIIASFNQPHIK